MVKLVVGNLPPSATNQSLKEIFHEYQDLKDYKLISNYGFVYLESEQSAMHAVYNLNGIEYRGFQITVDYVGDTRNKRPLPTASEGIQFQKVSNPIPKNPVQPQMEQRNANPYNLPFSNGSNGINKPVFNPQESRYGQSNPAQDNRYGQSYPAQDSGYGQSYPGQDSGYGQSYPGQDSGYGQSYPAQDSGYGHSLLEARNPNPYNLPFSNTSNAVPKKFNPKIDRRYDPEQYQEYNDPSYNTQPYANSYNMPNDEQYNYSEGYNEQYIPEEEYFSNVPPAKRPRTNQFNPTSGYGYMPRQPMNFPEKNYRQFRSSQPNFSDNRQVQMRPNYLHPRDESFYRPRGKKVYQPNRSYIDEYDDDQDYSEVDPYPAYLKQYKK